MPKIDEVVQRAGSAGLSPMQKSVLAELERREDEVFAQGDPALQQVFPDFNDNAIDWSLWALHKKGLIGKLKVKGDRKYFGCHAAIAELKRRLEETGKANGHDGRALAAGGREDQPPEAAHEAQL